MKAEMKVVPFPSAPKQRDREELAFLPAALEIVETPPSPIGRAIGVTLIAVFVLALAWASLEPCGHRGHRDREDYSDRPQQGDPAFRDRRRARHSGRRTAKASMPAIR